MQSTDNVKALAKRLGISRAAVRELAADLGLAVDYSAARRTWFIAESASTVRAFSAHLAEAVAR